MNWANTARPYMGCCDGNPGEHRSPLPESSRAGGLQNCRAFALRKSCIGYINHLNTAVEFAIVGINKPQAGQRPGCAR